MTGVVALPGWAVARRLRTPTHYGRMTSESSARTALVGACSGGMHRAVAQAQIVDRFAPYAYRSEPPRDRSPRIGRVRTEGSGPDRRSEMCAESWVLCGDPRQCGPDRPGHADPRSLGRRCGGRSRPPNPSAADSSSSRLRPLPRGGQRVPDRSTLLPRPTPRVDRRDACDRRPSPWRRRAGVTEATDDERRICGQAVAGVHARGA